MKNKKKNEPKVDPNMKDRRDHPFFKDKKKRAKEFLEKNPPPEDFLKPKNK